MAVPKPAPVAVTAPARQVLGLPAPRPTPVASVSVNQSQAAQARAAQLAQQQAAQQRAAQQAAQLAAQVRLQQQIKAAQAAKAQQQAQVLAARKPTPAPVQPPALVTKAPVVQPPQPPQQVQQPAPPPPQQGLLQVQQPPDFISTLNPIRGLDPAAITAYNQDGSVTQGGQTYTADQWAQMQQQQDIKNKQSMVSNVPGSTMDDLNRFLNSGANQTMDFGNWFKNYTQYNPSLIPEPVAGPVPPPPNFSDLYNQYSGAMPPEITVLNQNQGLLDWIQSMPGYGKAVPSPT